jgi:hypothetical protein
LAEKRSEQLAAEVRQAKYFQDPRLKDINDLLGDNRDNRDNRDRDSKSQAQAQAQTQQPLSLSQTLTNVLSQKVSARRLL